MLDPVCMCVCLSVLCFFATSREVLQRSYTLPKGIDAFLYSESLDGLLSRICGCVEICNELHKSNKIQMHGKH